MTLRRKVGSALRATNLVEPARAARTRSRSALIEARRSVAERLGRAALASSDDLVLGFNDRGWELARISDRLVVREVMNDNLALVADLLDQAGAPYLLFPDPATPNRWRVAVAERFRAAITHAVTALHDPATYLYVDDARIRPTLRRFHPGGRLTPVQRWWMSRAPVWRVYVNRADPAGHTVLGHLHGCEIEFWDVPLDVGATGDDAVSDGAAEAGEEAEAPAERERPTGTELDEPAVHDPRVLASARWNRYATVLPRGIVPDATVDVGGRSYSTRGEFLTAPHLLDVTFPIDLVYTWVDGRDPAWLDRKDEVLRGLDLNLTVRDAYDDSRYRSRDELKYSLRSVEMYADFVRHVYIVTDDQVPAWLDVGNPRVSIVSHKELFGDLGRLPTFNSHSIEATLHRIEGLAEHYIYLNDDFLFTRRVRPALFFASNGMSRFFPSRALVALPGLGVAGRSVDQAATVSQAEVFEQFDRLLTQKIRHAPYAQRRSVLYEAEQAMPEQFARTRASQVRSDTDLPVASSFSHHFGYLRGTAVPGTIRSRYVELGSETFLADLDLLERVRNSDTLCINDATAESTPDLDRRERRLREFLDRCWPLKSEFEK